jgi:hypothetical protein
MESENRQANFGGNRETNEDYQHFEHSPLSLVQFVIDPTSLNLPPVGQKFSAQVRIYCPDIRVTSRIACMFDPQDPNDFESGAYELSSIYNDVVAFRCIKGKDRCGRVGEIIGKNGVPYQFPKSVQMDGIAFQNNDDCPYIDVKLTLGFPGVQGTWNMYYHATSDNKLKKTEWERYISNVTMSAVQRTGVYAYSLPI